MLDGISYHATGLLRMIDFTFEDKYDSIRGMDLTSVSKIFSRITQIPFPDGTHMIASFGAFEWLWSQLLWLSLVTRFRPGYILGFEKNGVMDAKTGERYRKEILEVAASEEEMDMLRKFSWKGTEFRSVYEIILDSKQVWEYER